eukprot:1249032-Pleurochrysis_carterae.AAC.1
MDQAPQQPSSPQSFEVKNGRALQFQTACNIDTLGNIGTLGNTGARHIFKGIAAHRSVRSVKAATSGMVPVILLKPSRLQYRHSKPSALSALLRSSPWIWTRQILRYLILSNGNLVQSPLTYPQYQTMQLHMLLTIGTSFMERGRKKIAGEQPQGFGIRRPNMTLSLP